VITVPDHGVIHLYWGGETQSDRQHPAHCARHAGGGVDPQDNTTWPANSGPNIFGGLAAGDPNPYSGHYDQHPAYRGQCYAVFKIGSSAAVAQACRTFSSS
jgi:hypothetical protein